MNYHHGDLANAIIEWVVRTQNLERILALDLEAKVLEENGFLTNETILCVSLARFLNGKIQNKLILLKEEDSKSEAKLLAQLNDFLLETRPLVLVGFNLCGYDIPLLNLKLREYPNPIHWGIKDTIERSFHLDMKHPIRFELAKYSNDGPKMFSLGKAVEHPRFKHLPLMRTKSLVSQTIGSKGLEIYNMWKSDKRNFTAYAKGDANDVLLMFKELFLKPLLSTTTAEVRG